MATASAATATAPPTKDAITCHILDTTAGKPARGVRVKLEGPIGSHHHHYHHHNTSMSSKVGPGIKTFESRTDEDGRIKAWLPYSSATAGGDVPTYTLADVLDEIHSNSSASAAAGDDSGDGSSTWTLRFYTEDYWGGKDKTFFPEVVVTFTVLRGQTYHVPLLLSPYSYSTYRGS